MVFVNVQLSAVTQSCAHEWCRMCEGCAYYSERITPRECMHFYVNRGVREGQGPCLRARTRGCLHPLWSAHPSRCPAALSSLSCGRRRVIPVKGRLHGQRRVGGPCTILFSSAQRDARCLAPRCAHASSRHARKTPASCRARPCRPPANASAPLRRFFLDGVATTTPSPTKANVQAA